MLIEIYQYLMHATFFILVILFFISSLDELFMLLSFVVYRLYLLFSFRKKHTRLSINSLATEKQKPIAIMVACWDEKSVILDMLNKAINNIKYNNYHIFVGTYQNDLATQQEVQKACQKHPNIHQVVLNHNGPTTKSDNINSIWNYIQQYEQEQQLMFEIFVIHDAEDHIPAYGLAIFNHLIPRKDIVQLPVLPLPVPWYQLSAGTYLDEFAFQHLLTLRVREWISGQIPTSGVGCGFSREFLKFASYNNDKKGPLAYDTLTEDYELPLINNLRPNNEIFFDSIVLSDDNQKDSWVNYIPAVRSYFPRSMKRAIVQKSRWILGITLQGSQHLGWNGSFEKKYMLFRDRKGLITNLITFIALLLMIILLIDVTFRGHSEFLRLFYEHAFFKIMIVLNVIMMIILIATRVVCTSIVYGPIHGLLSIPRIYIGNIINGLATIRAIQIYFKSKQRGDKPIWEKTSHEI
jgi:adsorption protein B